jgi:signal peptidase I
MRNVATFLVQVARVEGGSMSLTVNDRDRLIVDKSTYRRGHPRRGDIVMLHYPLDSRRTFVQRVIAEEVMR